MSASCILTVECKYLVMLKYILDNHRITCELISDERQMKQQNSFTLKVTAPVDKSLNWLEQCLPHYVTIQPCVKLN